MTISNISVTLPYMKISGWLFSLCLLSACGQKGPLYHPLHHPLPSIADTTLSTEKEIVEQDQPTGSPYALPSRQITDQTTDSFKKSDSPHIIEQIQSSESKSAETEPQQELPNLTLPKKPL